MILVQARCFDRTWLVRSSPPVKTPLGFLSLSFARYFRVLFYLQYLFISLTVKDAINQKGEVIVVKISTVVLSFVISLVTAVSARAADVFVVHGIPGVVVDVYASAAGAPIPSIAAIPGFQPKSVRSLTAGPGAFDIRIYPAGANPLTSQPVIAVLGAAIPATGEVSIVAHLGATGTPTATIYRNDNSPVQSGWARVSVRHTAAAPPVQLVAGGAPKLALANPYFGDLEVPATSIPLQLQTPFAGAPLTGVVPLGFASARRYFVYAIGSLDAGTFDFLIHVAP
jgi:hypothetical protein